jgi:hypothetical protein
MSKIEDKKIESQLAHLEYARDAWSDVIPDRIVHSDSGIKTKARKNWFAGIVASTENALEENEITNPDRRKAAEELINHFTSDDFIDRKFTAEDDIAIANKLIDIILGRIDPD